jgi:quercetin dioxygenase-like cupin family protein
MRSGIALAGAVALWIAGTGHLRAVTTEILRNDKVAVSEVTLAPGERTPLLKDHASAVVYLAGEEAQVKLGNGTNRNLTVQRGKTVNEPPRDGELINTGHVPLRLVRVEFLTAGQHEMWGLKGLPPNYQILFEDEHSRIYNIRIAAHGWEPQHTHHDRVVVCLNGAKLEHVLPDGKVAPSTLKTDEVDWRLGQTHKGHNLGDTNLWVVAIEPK